MKRENTGKTWFGFEKQNLIFISIVTIPRGSTDLILDKNVSFCNHLPKLSFFSDKK